MAAVKPRGQLHDDTECHSYDVQRPLGNPDKIIFHSTQILWLCNPGISSDIFTLDKCAWNNRSSRYVSFHTPSLCISMNLVETVMYNDIYMAYVYLSMNTLKSGQNNCNFADNIFKFIFLEWPFVYLIQILMKLVLWVRLIISIPI